MNLKISKKILKYIPHTVLISILVGRLSNKYSIILLTLTLLALSIIMSIEFYNVVKDELKRKKIYWTAVITADIVLLCFLFEGLDVDIQNLIFRSDTRLHFYLPFIGVVVIIISAVMLAFATKGIK